VEVMARSLTVARVKGIPVRLHLTFLLILPLFAYLMAQAYFSRPGEAPDAVGWMWGALLAVGLFASVLAHEFAHSLMALREGVGVRHITLLPIGGVSAFESIPREPGKELRITLVGPLTNFVIGAPLLALFYVGVVPAGVPHLAVFVLALGALNVAIGAFNLLVPAFPMDGGRILRAALAMRMDRVKATRVASLVGQGLALLMAGFGFLSFGTGGWLLVVIAFFVFMGARSEEGATRLTEALEPYRVMDLMTRDVEVVDPDATVDATLERMLATRHLSLPVVDAEGRVRGLADVAGLQEVPEALRRTTRVETIARARFPTAAPGDPATELGGTLMRERLPVLVMRDDRLVGIVTPTDLARFTQLVAAARPRQPGPGIG
jgi:Zn-dependent protease